MPGSGIQTQGGMRTGRDSMRTRSSGSLPVFCFRRMCRLHAFPIASPPVLEETQGGPPDRAVSAIGVLRALRTSEPMAPDTAASLLSSRSTA